MRIFFLDRCFDQEDFGFIFKKMVLVLFACI